VSITIDASSVLVCSIAGSVVTFNAAGNCVIDANQAGNGNWDAAPQVTQTVQVGAPDTACTITWTGAGGDGDWTTPTNWDLDRLPNQSDVICIPSLGTTVTYFTKSPVDEGELVLGTPGAATTENLLIEDPFDLTSGGITYAKTTLEVQTGGSLTQGGTFIIGGGVKVDAGTTFTSNGTVDNEPGGAIDVVGSTASFQANDTFIQAGGTTTGTPVLIESATLVFIGGGHAGFEIQGGNTHITGAPYTDQTLIIAPTTITYMNASAVNNGIIDLLGASPDLSVNGQVLTSDGTILVPNTTTNAVITTGTVVSNGSIDDEGTLVTDVALTSSGPVTVGPGASLTASQSFENAAGGSIAVDNSATPGSFTLPSGNFIQDGGTTSGPAIAVQNSTLTFSGGGQSTFSIFGGNTHITGAPFSGQSLTILVDTNTYMNDSAVNAGTIVFAAGGDLNVNGQVLTNTGSVEVQSGVTDAVLTTGTVVSNGSIDDEGGLATYVNLTSSGPVTVGPGATFTANDSFTNNPGGSIAVDNSATPGSFTLPSGTFTQDGGTTSGPAIAVQNSTLVFSGGGQSTFSIFGGNTHITSAPFSGQTLTILVDTNTYLNNSVVNNGTIVLETGGDLNVNGQALTNPGTIEVPSGVTGAVITTGTVVSNGSIIDDGALATYVTLTSSGPVTVGPGASFTSNTSFENAAGGSIAVDNSATPGSFTEPGGTFIQDGGTTSGPAIAVQNSTLAFSGGGGSTFSIYGGNTHITGAPSSGQSLTILVGTNTYMNDSAVNAGTIDIESSAQLNVNGQTLTNTGTIEVPSGVTGALITTGTVENEGAIVDDGALTSDVALTSSGPITVGPGATFSANDTFGNGAGGSIAVDNSAKPGSFTLPSGTFTQDGGTTSGPAIAVQNSTLVFAGGGQSTFSIAGGNTHITGAPFSSQTLSILASTTTYMNNSAVNAGTIDIDPTSQLNVNGQMLTNTGTIELEADASVGSTITTGPVVNDGNVILEPGAPSTISGTYTQGTGGTLTTTLDSPTDFGSVNVSGATTLSGTLVAYTNYTPAPTATVTVMTTGGLSTQFGAEDYQGYANWTTAYPTNDVELTFKSLAVSPSQSKIVADPLSVPADGTTSSTVTVTLLDSSDNPVEGKTVSITPSPGTGSVITVVNDVTNAAGQAVFTVTDTHVETVVYGATDVTDNIELPGSADVTFTAGTVSPTNSTIGAAPTSVPADGVSSSTITVTLRDGSNNPVEGKTVALAGNAGGNSVITPVDDVTNAAGQATFTVTDTVVEVATYSATDTTDGIVVSGTAQVGFTSPSGPSAANSTVVATPTSVMDDGTSFTTITVTIRDGTDQPLDGQNVALSQDANGQSTISGGGTGTTNALGVVSFTATDQEPQVVVYSATDQGLAITETASVTFHGPVDPNTATLVANPTSTAAGGLGSTVTLTIMDGDNTPIPGDAITLAPDAGSTSIVTPVTPVTNASGQATFTVTDVNPELVTYTATDTTEALVPPPTAEVEFTNTPITLAIAPTPTQGVAGSSFTLSEAGFLPLPTPSSVGHFCPTAAVTATALHIVWDPTGSDLALGQFDAPAISPDVLPALTVPNVAPGTYTLEATCPDTFTSGKSDNIATTTFTVIPAVIVTPPVAPVTLPVTPVTTPTTTPITTPVKVTTTPTTPAPVVIPPTTAPTQNTPAPTPTPTAAPTPALAVPAPSQILDLGAIAISPGANVSATGHGCDADAPVLLTIDQNPVGHTTANSQGDFTAALATSSLHVGQYQVTAHCGPTLEAAFDVVLVAQVGQDGTTVVSVIFFILVGLAVFRRRINWNGVPRR
jgi:adhesin/invasin